MLIAIQRKAVVSLAAPLLGLAILMMSAPMSRKSSFDRPVEPEMVKSGTPQERWRLHNANIYHPATLRLNSDRQRKYRCLGL